LRGIVGEIIEAAENEARRQPEVATVAREAVRRMMCRIVEHIHLMGPMVGAGGKETRNNVGGEAGANGRLKMRAEMSIRCILSLHINFMLCMTYKSIIQPIILELYLAAYIWLIHGNHIH